MAWMRAEGGHWHNNATYNPLNTTQRMSGASSMNSVGVKAYTSWDQGLQATVITLQNGYYGNILSALQSGASAQSVANAVVGSPWGTKNISINGISVTGASLPTGAELSGGTDTANLSMADMAARFGLAAETLRENKTIKDLVSKAIKEGWDQTLFTAYLKNTSWWRTTTDAQRKYFFLRSSDPATYKQKHDEYAFSINQVAVQAGLTSQLVKGKTPTSLLERAIQYKMRDGWSDAQIKSYLAMYAGTHDGQMWGEAGAAFDQLHALTYANGITPSWQWYRDRSKEIVAGRTTMETVQSKIRSQAAAKYSAFADQIRAGQNVIDLAQPYISAVGQILELPTTDIDLSNKYVNKAMTSKQGPGGPGTQYPLWQFENDLRDDPLWRQTNNARESMFGVAHQVARDFGLAF